MKEKFILSVEGRKICGVIHLPSKKNPPFVITCHGLFSSKDSEKFISIAEGFSQKGLAVIRFDFGGCGESSGSISDTTVSRRLQELEKVARFALDHPNLGKNFCILGSSLGGFISLFYASQNPVKALSIWATPYDLKETFHNITENDLKILKNSFFSDAEKYNLPFILRKINTVQIIHGKRDEIVPWQHAEEIFKHVADPKELEILTNGDHSISGHAERDRALQASFSWLTKHI